MQTYIVSDLISHSNTVLPNCFAGMNWLCSYHIFKNVSFAYKFLKHEKVGSEKYLLI